MTFEENMKRHASSELMYDPFLTSVACGTDGNGFYLINYWSQDDKDKPPVLGKPLDKLGDKPFDMTGIMGEKSMFNFINYIRQAKGLKVLTEGTASQMSKGDDALNPKLYENCSTFIIV